MVIKGKNMTKLLFIMVFVMSIMFFSISFADVLVDNRMGHQKDSGYKSERYASDIFPNMVVRPEVNKDRKSNNRNQQWSLERKDDIFPNAWNRPFVDPWGRKFTSPGGLPIYGHRLNRYEKPRHRNNKYYNKHLHVNK
jgi:hypothetical protein